MMSFRPEPTSRSSVWMSDRVGKKIIRNGGKWFDVDSLEEVDHVVCVRSKDSD